MSSFDGNASNGTSGFRNQPQNFTQMKQVVEESMARSQESQGSNTLQQIINHRLNNKQSSGLHSGHFGGGL
jgi:hypothetical protein